MLGIPSLEIGSPRALETSHLNGRAMWSQACACLPPSHQLIRLITGQLRASTTGTESVLHPRHLSNGHVASLPGTSYPYEAGFDASAKLDCG